MQKAQIEAKACRCITYFTEICSKLNILFQNKKSPEMQKQYYEITFGWLFTIYLLSIVITKQNVPLAVFENNTQSIWHLDLK